MTISSSSPVRAALATFALALLFGCSTAVSAGGVAGSCPCVVGNAGIHMTIGCGESQCIDLNGQAIGYRCTASGATEDPAVCLADAAHADAPSGPGDADASGVDTVAKPDAAPAIDAGPCGHPCAPPETCGGGGIAGFCGCTPKTCADLQLCGTAVDDCGKPLACPDCASGSFCAADSHCHTPATSLIVIGNYQGGTFAINVDKHTPNLGIGLVSYQNMTVTIGGAYASDVVAVAHAGYQPGTTVSGVAPGLFSDALLPKASASAGPADVIVDDIPASPVPPTKAEIVAYFQKVLGGGALAFHQCQYDAYTSTLLVSQGGSCK